MSNDKIDHGQVVSAKRIHISAVWAFPLLAVVAAGWLFWSHWKSEGPEIQIQFTAAPGLQANKTLVICRGVEVGKVTDVSLDPALQKVVIKARLRANAAHLAQEQSVFWVDEPKVSLLEVTGLDAIIQGNSIQVRPGPGAKCTTFTGLNAPPLDPEDASTLTLRLRATILPPMVRGAPLYYHGIVVGTVKNTRMDENRTPYFHIVVDEKYSDLVRSNARFWILPAASAEIGPQGLKLDIAGVIALLQGGIAFDYFDGPPGGPVKPETEFDLFPGKEVARATSPPIHISLQHGMGLMAEKTELRYLGMPVGLIMDAHPDFETSTIDVTARFFSGFDRFRRKGTTFALVRPKISMKGISGLETIGRGVYIDCVPGSESDAYADHFIAEPLSEAEEETQEIEEKKSPIAEEKLEIVVTAKSTAVSPDAPVFYRGIQAGTVTRKALSADGVSVDLYLEIEPMYAPLVRENTKFWDVGGLKTSLGFFSIKVQATSIAAIMHGGIAFATPNNNEMGKSAKRDQQFLLYKSPNPEWKRWTPSLPAQKR